MQAVILAAGKSTRTFPTTLTRAKSLIKIANKTILEHNLEQLEGIIDEALIVAGFKKEMIKSFVEKKKQKFSFKVKFIEQEHQLGTGHALTQAESQIRGRFIVFGGDDLFHKKDIENCLKHENCILVSKAKDISKFGLVKQENGNLKEIIEKPKKTIAGLVNTGLFVLEKDIFKTTSDRTKRGEYEMTDMVTKFSKKKDVHCTEVKEYWLPIGYPWNILDANEVLLSRLKKGLMKGKVENGARVIPPVIIGKGALVKTGAYLEGPVIIGENSTIGENSFVRRCTSIGGNCKISNSVEIRNSVIMENTEISELSYIADSIIGKDVKISEGAITANSTRDKKEVKITIKGEQISTGRKEFGCVLGDGVHIGKNTYIYPGIKIYPRKQTYPGEVIRQDII